MRVYVDDEREAPTQNSLGTQDLPPWDAVCRHADEAITLLKAGKVTYISLDYHLQVGERNGLDVALCVLNRATSGIEPKLSGWSCHSDSFEGRKQIYSAMMAADAIWKLREDLNKARTDLSIELLHRASQIL